MHVKHLACVRCDNTYSADEIRYTCDCGASLDVAYDYGQVELSWDMLRDRPLSHYRYRELLPTATGTERLAMGGGGTPIIGAERVCTDHGMDLRFKLESLNPSGSFKDRGTSVELGAALDHGADEVVVASTGNMGASIAAYCARAGVTARVYIPEHVQGPKRRQMERHGADIIPVGGDYNDAAEQAWQEYEEQGTYLMGDYPYRGEGEKTVGHEIADQLTDDALQADTVIVPVGNGTLIHAVWKSFQEFKQLGLIDETPRLVGVQAAGCNTVVDALQKGFDDVEPVDEPDTVAGAIACGDPLDGEQALDAVQDSDGFGVAVTDDQIMDAKRRLAAQEGVYAEEAGAAGLAGILDDVDRFDADETVICLVTGHGLKT